MSGVVGRGGAGRGMNKARQGLFFAARVRLGSDTAICGCVGHGMIRREMARRGVSCGRGVARCDPVRYDQVWFERVGSGKIGHWVHTTQFLCGKGEARWDAGRCGCLWCVCPRNGVAMVR